MKVKAPVGGSRALEQDGEEIQLVAVIPLVVAELAVGVELD